MFSAWGWAREMATGEVAGTESAPLADAGIGGGEERASVWPPDRPRWPEWRPVERGRTSGGPGVVRLAYESEVNARVPWRPHVTV